MTDCRFGAVSEFGRQIDTDHLLGACVFLAVWFQVKQQGQTVLVSSPAADYKKPNCSFGCSNDANEELSWESNDILPMHTLKNVCGATLTNASHICECLELVDQRLRLCLCQKGGTRDVDGYPASPPGLARTVP